MHRALIMPVCKVYFQVPYYPEYENTKHIYSRLALCPWAICLCFSMFYVSTSITVGLKRKYRYSTRMMPPIWAARQMGATANDHQIQRLHDVRIKLEPPFAVCSQLITLESPWTCGLLVFILLQD